MPRSVMALAMFAALLVVGCISAGSADAAGPKVTVLSPAGVRCAPNAGRCIQVRRPQVRCAKRMCVVPLRVRSAAPARVRVTNGRKVTHVVARRGQSQVKVRVGSRVKRISVRLVSRPGSSGTRRRYVKFAMPTSTKPLAEGTVLSARSDGQRFNAVIAGNAPALKRGDGVVVAAQPAVPDGMFAKVVSVARHADGARNVTLAPAAVNQVLSNVSYELSGPVTPQLVDSSGAAIGESVGGATTMSLTGSFSSHAANTAAFTCSSKGVARNAADLWETDTPFPIELAFEHTKVLHRVDLGNPLLRRDPYFLFQVSGQVVASVGFRAKSSFECELSTAFRRTHRLGVPLGVVAGVPVTMYFEPHLSFTVSASGELTFSQRHFYAFTVEKVGFEPLSVRRAGSADPVEFSGDAELSASLFTGGDISVMFGASRGQASIQAGVYGAFGPEFTVATSASRPGCISGNVRMKADLGIRLNLWVQRWNHSPASLNGPKLKIEKCVTPPQAPPSAPAPTQAIRTVDFMNREYRIECPGGEFVSIAVRGGKWSRNRPNGSPEWFPVYDPPVGVTYGDLDGDGAEEAAVTTDCSAGGSGTVSNTMVFAATPTGAVQLGDAVQGRNPSFESGRLLTRFEVRSSTDPAGSHSWIDTAYWQLTGGSWIHERTARHPAPRT